MIYFLKHIAIEGPGTLGDFLTAQGRDYQEINLYNGQPLPDLSDDIELVVVLGGPMNVYEEDKYPFLKEETEFIRKLIQKDIPTLGLCLGSQLIAKAAGASVYRAPKEEIGIFDIFLTEEGQEDPLFSGVEQKTQFFQWHGDTFDVPEGGVLLGRGTDCPNQIFRLGTKVYGFQCHMEITLDAALEWADEYCQDEYKKNVLKERIGKEFHLSLCLPSENIYNNLLILMNK